MIAFVARIAAHARTQDEDFFVVPQNGERLLGFDPNGAYLEVIDGIGVEDLFYDGSTALPSAVWTERAKYLDAVWAAGKPVLVVDYVYAGSRDLTGDEFVTRATAAGYFPYAAGIDRELDRLVVFAGQGK